MAGFFLPYLQPGMRLLDCGSGPGSITLDLAEAVAPGEVVGIDLQPAQVDRARALASERGVANARFEAGDIYQLPFAGGSFDAVFASFVLFHLREPVRALKEMRRVLRPGGVAGIRDPDFGTRLMAPTTPLMEQAEALQMRVFRHDGADPFYARNQHRLLLEAGFARATTTATLQTGGSVEQRRAGAAYGRIIFQGMFKTAVAQGWVDSETVELMLAELTAWAERPDAFFVLTYCEAVAWNEG